MRTWESTERIVVHVSQGKAGAAGEADTMLHALPLKALSCIDNDAAELRAVSNHALRFAGTVLAHRVLSTATRMLGVESPVLLPSTCANAIGMVFSSRLARCGSKRDRVHTRTRCRRSCKTFTTLKVDRAQASSSIQPL